jgi:hypothetical protein
VTDTAVVYLIRAAEGLEPVTEFVRSYTRYPADWEHELLVICKGFDDPGLPPEYLAAFGDIPVRLHSLADDGFDLDAYFAVGRSYDYRSFFFMNTFCRIRRRGWLKFLMTALHRTDVGIVGVTGSYESLPLPGFPPFPNAHLRTNAFGIERDILTGLEFAAIREKEDAYAIESGPRSLTSQVLGLSLDAVLVGRNGRSYSPPDWWKSQTFRQRRQANVLVGDNQTERYRIADRAERKFLSGLAWGRYSRV